MLALPAMDMINGLMEKVGLDEDQAKKVVEFLKENASKIPGWLGQGLDAVTDTLGLGGDEDLFAGIREQMEEAKKQG